MYISINPFLMRKNGEGMVRKLLHLRRRKKQEIESWLTVEGTAFGVEVLDILSEHTATQLIHHTLIP